MRKIPTIFERDWNGDRSLVLDKVTPGCEWVFAGEGVATRKLDGTCCMVRAGKLYKRREWRAGENLYEGDEIVERDEATGKIVGWTPCNLGSNDQWHMEAFGYLDPVTDGTYELLGPKVQGNPERHDRHELVRHDTVGLAVFPQPRRTFTGLRGWLSLRDMEGVVFHHPDGRMAKIKRRDFGLRRD